MAGGARREDALSELALGQLAAALDRVPTARWWGRLVESAGPLLAAELPGATLGASCEVDPDIRCDVVAFKGQRALLMPLDRPRGVAFGARVRVLEETATVPVGDGLLGRVIDGFGRPLDGGPPPAACERQPIFGAPPAAMQRPPVTDPLWTGVKVIDALATLGVGQRIAILAGPGVGKSTLLGMIARQVKADVVVACLVGERGREVPEFVARDLGAGLPRSVVVAVTSDQSPAAIVRAPFAATSIAEHFRDQGKQVLLLVDSLTRLALAQRQIGLATGEPPTTRGFVPSCFALLPVLLERAGRAPSGGSITGIYTVLTEAGDPADPIGDAVRGIVDGHIVLSSALASHGQLPAVDVLGSLSRLMPLVVQPTHLRAAASVRDMMATYAENEELIRLGAYRRGSVPEIDVALDRVPKIKGWLRQSPEDRVEPPITIGAMYDFVR